MLRTILLVFAIMLVGAACNKAEPQQVNKNYSDGYITIAGREVSFEHADNAIEQRLGLSNRDAIEENQGMLFTFAAPNFPVFWMKDMKFDIDMVWIKGDEVVDITKNVKAEPGVTDDKLKTYTPKQPSDKILELKDGWADRNGLKVGDKIEIVRVVQ